MAFVYIILYYFAYRTLIIHLNKLRNFLVQTVVTFLLTMRTLVSLSHHQIVGWLTAIITSTYERVVNCMNISSTIYVHKTFRWNTEHLHNSYLLLCVPAGNWCRMIIVAPPLVMSVSCFISYLSLYVLILK